MSKKLPEIERTPGGDLPRMTPAQRRRSTALIRKTCCNYENGDCLLLDDEEECVCPQTISYSVCPLGGAATGQGAGSGAPNVGRFSSRVATEPDTTWSVPQG